MRSFRVTVHAARVEIRELDRVSDNRQPEHIAIVDGTRHQYFVEKDTDCKAKTWRATAHNALFYHAANSGCVVKWQPVTKLKKARKKDISKHQLRLF